MQRTDAVNIILKVFLPCRCQCEATGIRPLTETDKMKTLTITREQFQDLEDAYDDAMSDRNVLLLRSIKAEMVEWIEAAHAEALAEWFDRLDSDLLPEALEVVVNVTDLPSMDHDRAKWLENRLAIFWGACDDATRASMTDAAHDEALEINQCFDFNVQQVKLAAEHQRSVLERLA